MREILTGEKALSANHDRLRVLFGRPELQRLVKRLCERRELGRPLTGTVTLDAALPDERRAIDQLLRRATTTGASLGIPLDKLLRQLRTAQIADSWSEILDVLCGPPDPHRALAAAKFKSWEELWNRVRTMRSSEIPMVLEWLEQLRRDGLLKRLSCNEPKVADLWISQAIDLFRQLPLDDEPLARLAARLVGNSHGLDPGAPLATIALRGLALIYRCSVPKSAAERRELWFRAGIVCDELSAPVLTFNLLLRGTCPLAELLGLASAAVVPLHLSTRLLQVSEWRSVLTPPRVYVCENPSIVAFVVRHLGASSAPLICLDGEPKTAGWLLLQHLRNAGTELWYHGDFDWEGIAIAGRIINRVDARPWRYTADDYLAASGTEPLEGSPVPTPWCPKLATALSERQVVIHEEAVAELLLKDLQTPTAASQTLDSHPRT
jgi:uncharacterized protein (TIGR02679 family)